MGSVCCCFCVEDPEENVNGSNKTFIHTLLSKVHLVNAIEVCSDSMFMVDVILVKQKHVCKSQKISYMRFNQLS